MNPAKPKTERAAAPKKKKKRLGSILPRAYCYIGMELTGQALNGLLQHQRELAALCDSSNFAVRWVTPLTFHVTMRFLGRYDPVVLQAVQSELNREIGLMKPPEIKLSGLSVVPNIEEPEYIWAGVQPENEELNMLNQRLDLALTELGFEPKAAEPLHVTLGIVCSGKPSTEFLAHLERLDEKPIARLAVRELLLFSAAWNNPKPEFTVHRRVVLGGGETPSVAPSKRPSRSSGKSKRS